MEEKNSAFIFDKSSEPVKEQVNGLMGKSAALWQELMDHLKVEPGNVSPEWKFYSKKSGWTGKMMFGKRNLFFYKPLEDAFALTFVFGDRAVNAILESDLPEKYKQELREAKKYMEGRGLRLVIQNKDELHDAQRLVEIKLKN